MSAALIAAVRIIKGKRMVKKVALVTGGVGGIGSAICNCLAHDGLRVVANYAAPGSEIGWLEQMRSSGFQDVTLAHGDVSDFDAMSGMVRRIESEVGPVQVLVNCAGITRDAVFHKMSKRDWDAVEDQTNRHRMVMCLHARNLAYRESGYRWRSYRRRRSG